MDYIIIFSLRLVALLNCLEVVLEVLSNYKFTLKINETLLLGPLHQFVGFGVIDKRGVPSGLNQASFAALKSPKNFSNVLMCISIFHVV